jgi:outer membrane receptor protein involved in Fe transport
MKWRLCFGALVQAGAAMGQAAPPASDTLRPRLLDPVVVTAARTGSPLRTSAAAVTRIGAARLARVPQATLADLLRSVPGFAIVDFDGLGFDPQLMARGFYGGGQAEYVIVQVNGKPVNQVMHGLVAWDALPPPASIEAVEVLRGGASSLYGDAAIGGVINLITRAADSVRTGPEIRWQAAGGGFGTVRAAADLGERLSAAVDRTDGFRRHAERLAGRARATIPLRTSSSGRLALSFRADGRRFEEPGPLLESLLAADRRGSDLLFRFDETTDRSLEASLGADWRAGDRTALEADLGFELRDQEAIRTLALAPGFGDTKAREAETGRVLARAQLTRESLRLPGNGRLVAGFEASRATLDSRYFLVTGGTRADYASAAGERGTLDTHARSARAAAAAYFEYAVQASGALRLTMGGRLDVLHDSFEPRTPASEPQRSSTHSALSPRVGASLRYASAPGSVGHAYLALGRSFKAPTLDQKFDLRNIPIPFPPFELRTSNPDLSPQHGGSVEAGLYHTTLISDAVQASGSLSLFQMEMRDELDFDVEAFRYVNIGKSRHRGAEAGLEVESGRASALLSYALQAATSRSGANAGRRLKAIPRHTLSAGLSLRPLRSPGLLEVSAMVYHLRGMYLDDANTRSLPDYTRVDLRVALRALGMGFHLDVRNLTASRYSSTGFLDPGGSGEAYLYPAAGRVLEASIRNAW